MKKQFIATAFLSCLLSVCLLQNIFAQTVPTVWNNCPENGISTNPQSPVNPQNAAQINGFNWLNREFPINGAGNPSDTFIASPFWQTNNDLIGPLRTSQDQSPTNGWELITQSFGYIHQSNSLAPMQGGQEFPYYILYNKYTAVMRVFFAAESYRFLQGNFNTATINVKFYSSSHQSSVLMLADEPAAIFDKFIRGQNMTSATAFNNYSRRWVYADFPMTYDPCACNFRSKLTVSLILINEANIRMVGQSEGLIKTVDGIGEVNQKESKWTLQNTIGAGKKPLKLIIASMLIRVNN